MGVLVSILFTINIISENEDSETICDSILEAIEHKGKLLKNGQTCMNHYLIIVMTSH